MRLQLRQSIWQLPATVVPPSFHREIWSASISSNVENVKGKLCGYKGYIGKQLFEFLFMNGIQLITKVKNNMRNSLMSVSDKIMLRKKALVESVNDELKNIAQIEHSRHRPFANFITNALCAIAAYPKSLRRL